MWPATDVGTLDVAVSADIGATMLAKISAADVIFADVTIIKQGLPWRLTRHPNVMVEVGYGIEGWM